MHDLEIAGLTDCTIHGHEVSRPSGATYSDAQDGFSIVPNVPGEQKWACKMRNVDLSSAYATQLASVFYVAELTASPQAHN